MELQYKQQPLQNNFMGASYASGGLQSHTWELQWGPRGLELAIKRTGMSQVITQNFSTDPMGRILSMTYNGATYNGELYFHYDVQGNTSLLTDSNGQAVASFRYDLHNGRIAASWNPNNLELVNLKGGRQGSIRITTAVTGFDRDIYIPSWPPIEINPLPVNGNGNGNDWGGIGAAIGIGAYTDTRVTDTEKDCGVMDMQYYDNRYNDKFNPDDCDKLFTKDQWGRITGTKEPDRDNIHSWCELFLDCWNYSKYMTNHHQRQRDYWTELYHSSTNNEDRDLFAGNYRYHTRRKNYWENKQNHLTRLGNMSSGFQGYGNIFNLCYSLRENTRGRRYLA